MARKTKPIYLFIAGVLLLLVVLIFAFLLVQAYNANAVVRSATSDEEPMYNNQYKDDVIAYTEPSEEGPTVDNLAVDNVIRIKGLCADKNEKVFDADNNTYTVTDGYIAVVYEGEVYKISVKYIREVSPAKEKTKTSSKTSEPSETKSESTKNANSDSRQTNSGWVSSETTGSVSVSQAQNVTRQTNGDLTASDSVKMNYRALSVKANSLFSLVLTGADNSVSWQVEDSLVEIYQINGNQCSFTATKKGITQVVAQYKGESYYCTITIA